MITSESYNALCVNVMAQLYSLPHLGKPPVLRCTHKLVSLCL